jgi:septin family protein
MDQKYFIITAGPTGSGKTSLVNHTFEYLSIPRNEPYAHKKKKKTKSSIKIIKRCVK